MNNGKILLDFFCPALSSNPGFQLLLGGSTFNNSVFSTGVSSLSLVPADQAIFNFRRTLFDGSSIDLGGFDAYINSANGISIITYDRGTAKGDINEYYSTFINSIINLSETTLGFSATFDIYLVSSNIRNTIFNLSGNTLGNPVGSANGLLISFFECDLFSVNINAYSLDASQSQGSIKIKATATVLSHVDTIFNSATLPLTSSFDLSLSDNVITNSELTLANGSAEFIGSRFSIGRSLINNSFVGLMTADDRVDSYNYEKDNSILECLISNSHVKFDQGVSDRSLQNCNIYDVTNTGLFAGNADDHWLLLQDPLDTLITYYQYQDMTLRGNEIEVAVKYNATGGFTTGVDYDLGYFIPPSVSFNEIRYGEDLNWVTSGANVEVFEQQDLLTLKLTTNNLFDYRTAPETTDVLTKSTQINQLFFTPSSDLAPGVGQQLAFTLKGRKLNF